MILALLYLLAAMAASVAVIRFGPVHAAAMCVILGSFWFESSILVFRVYNVILPLPSFALLILGAFAVGTLATFWDFESEGDSRETAGED